MDNMQENTAGIVPEEQENTVTSATAENKPRPWYKLPVITIPAVLVLLAMAYIFATTLVASMQKYSIRKGWLDSPYIGFRHYQTYLANGDLWSTILHTVLARLLVLGVCGGLTAAMCAAYRKMKKPGEVLTIACLWLILAAIPVAAPEFPGILYLVKAKMTSGELIYLVTVGLQTLGIFCFITGLFTYLKKDPFHGLLLAALIWLLGNLSTNAVYVYSTNKNTLLNIQIFCDSFRGGNIGQGAALSVIKILLQVLIGIIPAILLCRNTRKKAALTRSTRAEYWLVPVAATGTAAALLLAGPAGKIEDQWLKAAVYSLAVAMAGAAVGGVIAYSFVRLMTCMSGRLYTMVAVILSAAMSCVIAEFMAASSLRMIDRPFLYALLSAFDWRMILLMVMIGSVLRNTGGKRPVLLASALALLAASFTWGELNIAMLYESASNTIGSLFLAMIKNLDVWWEKEAQILLVMAVPPLLMGTGAAFLMKRAFTEPKE